MAPFVITVTGSSNLSHAAELATLNITIAETSKIYSEACTIVLHVSNTIKSLLNDKSKPGSEDGIVSWTSKTIPSISYDSLKGSRVVPRVATSFAITFRDFVLLAEWAVMLAAMKSVKVENINWTVKKETKALLKGKSRRASAADALGKAGDFAQALGIERERVQPLELKDSEVGMHARGNNGSGGLGMLGDLGGWEVKGPLVFAVEEISFNHRIDAKFAVESPERHVKH